VRNRKISLRSAYEITGHTAYRYTGGFNWVGLFCVVLGCVFCNVVFDAVNYSANLAIFNYCTASLLGFVFTGVVYYGLSKVPSISTYLLKDRSEVTV